MNTKHTPGPWATEEAITKVLGLQTWEVSSPSKSVWVAMVRGDGDEEMIANAKLIAAAPELLEALKHIQSHFQNGFDGWPDNYMGKSKMADMVNGAITKATE